MYNTFAVVTKTNLLLSYHVSSRCEIRVVMSIRVLLTCGYSTSGVQHILCGLFCLSLSCVPYVDSFSDLLIFDYPFDRYSLTYIFIPSHLSMPFQCQSKVGSSVI
jgi:hypothetical protein